MGWREQVLNVAKQSKRREIQEKATEQLENIRLFRQWQEKREQEREERRIA